MTEDERAMAIDRTNRRAEAARAARLRFEALDDAEKAILRKRYQMAQDEARRTIRMGGGRST